VYIIKFGCDESKVEKVMNTIRSTLGEDSIDVEFKKDFFFYYAMFNINDDYSSTLDKLNNVLVYMKKKNIVDYFFIGKDDVKLEKAIC